MLCCMLCCCGTVPDISRVPGDFIFNGRAVKCSPVENTSNTRKGVLRNFLEVLVSMKFCGFLDYTGNSFFLKKDCSLVLIS